MRKIWFGLLAITTGVGAIAMGCAGQLETPGSGGSGGADTTTSTSTGAVSSSSQSGSSSGMSSSSAASSSSSGGGGCTLPEECPGMDTECQKRSCSPQGVCGFTFIADGTPISSQTAGDCKKAVCDGKGGSEKAVADDTDRPVDGKVCTADLCNNGTPSNPTAMKGSACNDGAGGKVCDGTDKCVQCLAATECPGVDTECQKRACVQGACDFAFTPDETPIASQTAGDCKQNVCDGQGGSNKTIPDDTDKPVDGKVCTDDVCSNGSPSNPTTPSGGLCSEGAGQVCDGIGNCVQCVDSSQCAGGLCQANACVGPNCTDQTKNGSETGIDCGGPVCNACADGEGCGVNTDCTNKICTGNICQAPTCADRTTNGAETDIDCGGGNCPQCSDGKSCAGGGDCLSKVCTGSPLVCQVPTCIDGVKNGPETDADCGGICTTKCGAGKGCGVNADCTGGICTSNTCEPTCTDGEQDGTETDIDCGGGCPSTCGLGKGCSIGGDCATGICTDGVCSTPPLINGCDPATALDMTGQPNVTVVFGGAVGLTYSPKCIKVSAGTQVTFNGTFGSHPLVAGEVVGTTKVPAAPGTSPLPTNAGGLGTGTTATFTMAPIGNYPYYCNPHAPIGMNGAIFVVP
jgi:plastocyanin